MPSSNNNNNPTLECVGSLLVHSSDMKEVTHESHHGVLDKMSTELKSDECYGTLLVHQSDMKEVTHESRVLDKMSNELKQDECVGTLLVHKSDMEEVSGIDNNAGGNNSSSLARRVTDHMNHSPEITREEVQDLFNDV